MEINKNFNVIEEKELRSIDGGVSPSQVWKAIKTAYKAYTTVKTAYKLNAATSGKKNYDSYNWK